MASIAFWEVTSPLQVVFNGPLPAGTEVPNREGAWAVPRMVRVTRFPMGGPLVPTEARQSTHIAKTREYNLLVAWMWTDDDPPKISMAFFRNRSEAILKFGETKRPAWFLDLDEISREKVPTAWDRLMGDDEL